MATAQQLLNDLGHTIHESHCPVTDTLHAWSHGNLPLEKAHLAIADEIHGRDLSVSDLAELMQHINDNPHPFLDATHNAEEKVGEAWDDYPDYPEYKHYKKSVGPAEQHARFLHATGGAIVGASLAHPITRHLLLTHAKNLGSGFVKAGGNIMQSLQTSLGDLTHHIG